MARILIADGAVDSAEGLSVLLAAMGHETRVSFDGVDALRVAGLFAPTIVFLDIDIPGLDGYQTALAMRADPSLVRPYLIALTSSEGRAVNDAVKAVGFDCYMKKPADTMTLIAVVTEVAERS